MIISEKIQAALNQQVANELGASNQYIHIASYFDRENLLQFAQLFFDQSDEERMHALKFVSFINEAGGLVEITDIPASKPEFSSPIEAVQAALDWETEVTKQINNIMDIAVEDKDYMSQDFMRWFVTEQLEEISKMGTILGILKKAGDNLLLAEQTVMLMPVEGEAA